MEHTRQGQFINTGISQNKIVLKFDIGEGSMPHKFSLQAHEAERLGVELIAMSDRLHRENCNEFTVKPEHFSPAE